MRNHHRATVAVHSVLVRPKAAERLLPRYSKRMAGYSESYDHCCGGDLSNEDQPAKCDIVTRSGRWTQKNPNT